MSSKQVGRALLVMAIISAITLANYALLMNSRHALIWLCIVITVGGAVELIILALPTDKGPDTLKRADHAGQHESPGGSKWPATKLADADATFQFSPLAERMIQADDKTR